MDSRSHVRILVDDPPRSSRGAKQVDQNYVVLRYLSIGLREQKPFD